MDEIEAEILGYSQRGHGIALAQGKDVKIEVKNAFLGEVVTLLKKSKRKRKGLYQGELVEILKPSTKRQSPRCPHTKICNGCSFQQLSIDEQIKIKEEKVAKLLKDRAASAKVLPTITSEDPWHYRNKMEYTFTQDKELTHSFLGLMEHGRRGKAFNIFGCQLVNSWHDNVLDSIRRWWSTTSLLAYFPPKGKGTLKTLTLREGINTNDKLVMLTVSGEPLYGISKAQIQGFKEAVLEALGDNTDVSIFLQVVQAKKGVKTQTYEMLLHGKDMFKEKLFINSKFCEKTFDLHISPSSFFQPNTKTAGMLYSACLDIVGVEQKDLILDLYCGTGTFSMVFSGIAKEVVGIEINPYAVYDGEQNLKANKISNVSLIKGDVFEEVKKLEKTPDLVIVDPPRSGLGEKALEQITAMSPKEILYVSCNPRSLKEDLLSEHIKGYSLEAYQVVDQFPHTPHVETIAYLKK